MDTTPHPSPLLITMSLSHAELDTILRAQRSAFESCLKVFADSINARVDGLLTQVVELKTGLAAATSRLDILESRGQPISQRLIDEITSSIEELEEKTDYLENQSRRNNLRVEGLPETPGETWAGTEASLRSALVTDLGLPLSDVEKIPIERAHRVGKLTSTTTGSTRRTNIRPVVVKFHRFKDRETILQKAREHRPDGLFFKEDFSARVLQTRRSHQPELQRLRAEGKTAYLSYDKLIVRGAAPGSYPRRVAASHQDPTTTSTPSPAQESTDPPATSSAD